MARALRIQFPGAVYHVTSRGDRREPIFVDDCDRQRFLEVLAQAMARFDALVTAYCLMGNHYHLVLHTRRANLSRVMRHINAVYSQAFNRRHDVVGHLFQGRFKAILVDRDAYLLELCRYVELNPVRARMVAAAACWKWSSYGAHVGAEISPDWLDTDAVHGVLLGHACKATRIVEMRSGGTHHWLPPRDSNLWDALRRQIYLGDDAFIEKMQGQAEPRRLTDKEIFLTHRSNPQTLAHWLATSETREEALHLAHTESGISMSALAGELNLSVSRVSRLIARAAARKRRPVP
jgi:REP element-mobilizing transposase RayT